MRFERTRDKVGGESGLRRTLFANGLYSVDHPAQSESAVASSLKDCFMTMKRYNKKKKNSKETVTATFEIQQIQVLKRRA